MKPSQRYAQGTVKVTVFTESVTFVPEKVTVVLGVSEDFCRLFQTGIALRPRPEESLLAPKPKARVRGRGRGLAKVAVRSGGEPESGGQKVAVS